MGKNYIYSDMTFRCFLQVESDSTPTHAPTRTHTHTQQEESGSTLLADECTLVEKHFLECKLLNN